MGSCCSKDLDDKRSWSPEETKNGSTTSTIIAQPMDDVGSTGVFTLTRTTANTTTTTTTKAGTTTTTTTESATTADSPAQD
ncbi:LOW QUALITY PROTEIN: salivary glue protein Sgs-3 [Drosophila sulfurigaster albostrigata]|uniref:LOW QUALITY PROTEIN: salivary glue protein Sgs-3 n=1 Tax=Drosophila sulfurigaster albostrigata TaxID=89887 RepID=UPI002D21D0A1|nr:LOW QUALITY PROTEIN: salivary glue protein Sgs-3 [Drosophila sulfurigaster albostrigata]